MNVVGLYRARTRSVDWILETARPLRGRETNGTSADRENVITVNKFYNRIDIYLTGACNI